MSLTYEPSTDLHLETDEQREVAKCVRYMLKHKMEPVFAIRRKAGGRLVEFFEDPMYGDEADLLVRESGIWIRFACSYDEDCAMMYCGYD